MGHDGKPTRQEVNLSLPVELLDRARACTRNLSGTMEDLLADYVAREEARRQEQDEAVRRTAASLGRLMQRHGTVADDFSPI